MILMTHICKVDDVEVQLAVRRFFTNNKLLVKKFGTLVLFRYEFRVRSYRFECTGRYAILLFSYCHLMWDAR